MYCLFSFCDTRGQTQGLADKQIFREQLASRAWLARPSLLHARTHQPASQPANQPPNHPASKKPNKSTSQHYTNPTSNHTIIVILITYHFQFIRPEPHKRYFVWNLCHQGNQRLFYPPLFLKSEKQGRVK